MEAWLSQHWYLIGALLIQVFGAQKIKFFLPLGWTDFVRARVVEALAGVLGLLAGAGMYITVDGVMQPAGVTRAIMAMAPWVGLVICFAGPMLYKAVAAVIYKWKPELAGTLSSDMAARVKRKLVQNAAGEIVEMDSDTATPAGDKTVAEFSRTVFQAPPADSGGKS